MKFCSLFSGSSGNCQYIKTDKASILVDAGLSGKKIQEAMSSIDEKPEDLKGIFITHEHSDHIKGVGILSRRFNLPIYANEKTWNTMLPSLGKIKEENIRIIDDIVELEDIVIQTFNISHDAADPIGYKIFNKDKKISLLTDTGCITPSMKKHINNSDLLLIEANHDEDMVLIGSYPWPLKKRVLSEKGHMSNELAGNTLCEILTKGTETVLLGHLSKENNFPELAYKTVENILKSNNIPINKGISLNMTYRDKSTQIFSL